MQNGNLEGKLFVVWRHDKDIEFYCLFLAFGKLYSSVLREEVSLSCLQNTNNISGESETGDGDGLLVTAFPSLGATAMIVL